MANGLPKDPMLLLSVVNTKLRDYYHNLDALCDDMNVEKEEIVNTLKTNDYEETHFIRYAVSGRRRHGLSTEIRPDRYGVYPQADTFLSTGQPTDLSLIHI